MHVDDRLATVLDARTDGKTALRVQYRQLLDLVGTTPAAARSDRLDQAMVRLSELAGLIPHEERARAVGEAGVRLRNPGLVALLAGDHPQVALAAIRAARLAPAEWLDLVPALPLAARGFLRLRRDLGADFEARLDQLGITDRALPAGEQAIAAEPAAEPAPTPRLAATSPPQAAPGAGNGTDGIAAIVRRIEAFRASRSAAPTPQAANDSPRLPLGEQEAAPRQVAAFSFTTDGAGRIGWAEGPVAPMVVGLLLPGLSAPDGDTDGAIEAAIRNRQPLRAVAVRLDGAPAIEGTWQLDAVPDFSPGGRFLGHVGKMRRPAPAIEAPAHPEADRIRQVLHELRTPVNAIQGFAEVIQQQLFGAILHEYRALAAGIAGDAARILAGFDELDRFARLESGVLAVEPGSTDLAEAAAGIIGQLEGFTAARASGFALSPACPPCFAGMARAEVDALLWRLLATLAGAARPGEVLPVVVASEAGASRLAVRLPEGLASLADPFGAAPPQAGQAVSAGAFGSGFTLRLAAAEARAAGGSLSHEGGELVLRLAPPAGLTAKACFHTSDSLPASSAG